MTVKERLIVYLEEKKISKSAFGKSIGVSNAYVTSIRKSIDKDKIKSIAFNYPDLNLEWLLYGEGEMLKQECQEQKNDPTNENFLKFLHEENKELNKKIWELEAENERLRKRLKTV
jgi:transcriptional regulator with XRE-family HTH domain